MVEFAAIGLCDLQIENRIEDFLHFIYVRADPDARASLRFQILRSGQMVGMGMGLEDPFHSDLFFGHLFEKGVGARRRQFARAWIVVEDRIDDGSVVRHRINDQIGSGVCGLVKE